MRDTLGSKIVTYGLLAMFVIMVAVPLFWMVTTAIKTNKELYEDFSYFPQRPTLENFVRVIVREKLLTNIRNSFSVSMITTLITVMVSSLAAYSIVRYRYPGREWIGRIISLSTCCSRPCCLCPCTSLLRPWGSVTPSRG